MKTKIIKVFRLLVAVIMIWQVIPESAFISFLSAQSLASDENEIETMEKEVLSFLRGNDKILKDKILEKIKTHSDNLNFELALELKKDLDYININAEELAGVLAPATINKTVTNPDLEEDAAAKDMLITAIIPTKKSTIVHNVLLDTTLPIISITNVNTFKMKVSNTLVFFINFKLDSP